MDNSRAKWGNNFGFLMAAVGSAVGLGNIWGFPYKMGANGGFAFLLVYLLLVLFAGFIIMVSELALGRKSGLGVVGTYRKLSKKVRWLGWLGIASAFLVTSFCCVLGGYCIKYIVVNLGELFGASWGIAGQTADTVFSGLLSNQLESIVYTLIFLAATCLIVRPGISAGIEKFSKVAMPTLFVMLIIVIIRSVTLPGASEGLKYMLVPDFEPLRENFMSVLSVAGGQMFFSLALGMGAMVTYGSYLSKSENIEKNALIVVLSDTLVAVMSAFAVLPAAFALGGEGAAMAGPRLLFVTLQDIFEAMGNFGPFFGLLFYILVFIAAITSTISLVEVIAAYFVDKAEEKGKVGNHSRATLITSAALIIPAIIVAADGMGSNGMWQPLGFNWLDFMTLWSEGIMMPLGTLLMSMFICYELSVSEIGEEITQNGNIFRSRRLYGFCCKVIVPLTMLLILYGQLRQFGIIK